MINTSIGLLGVALQTAKATAAAAPVFKHGLTGGGLVKPERSIEQKNVACGLRANASNGAYVSEVNMGIDFETLAYADALGLYAYAQLGNVISTPDTKQGYYKHVITLGSALPYLTFWGQIGDTSESTVSKAIGCKMDTLSVSFEGNNPLEIGITAAGIDAELFGAWSGEVEPSCFDGYFIPTDGAFLLDTSTAMPAEAVVTSGSMELGNSLTAYRSAGRVVPAELSEGKLSTSGSMKVIPEDWTLIRKLLTGSENGTKVTSKIVYGSLKWTFTHSQDASCKLEIEAKNIPFNCDTPEVDPEGDSAEIDFSFDDVGIASKSGTPVTITIVNKVQKYV